MLTKYIEKVFNISYNIWKKTIKTICQLSYFVGYPVFGNLSRFQLIKNQQNCSNVRLISPSILKIQRKYWPHFRMLSHLNYSRLNYCSFELLHVVPRAVVEMNNSSNEFIYNAHLNYISSFELLFNILTINIIYEINKIV